MLYNKVVSIIGKIIEKVKIRFSFLNRNNSSEVKQKIVDSQTGNIVGRDLNINNQTTGIKLSNIEKQVLKLLYLEYKSGKSTRLKILDVHTELEIKDGQYVGMLNNSRYIKTDTEDYILNDDGIRYMDNLSQIEIKNILLPREQRARDEIMEQQRLRSEERRKNHTRNSYE